MQDDHGAYLIVLYWQLMVKEGEGRVEGGRAANPTVQWGGRKYDTDGFHHCYEVWANVKRRGNVDVEDQDKD